MKPTGKQRKHFARVVAVGCMACLQNGHHTEPEIHHAKSYGYRNHDEVFGLCAIHHRTGNKSRHLDPSRFAEKYGTDAELLQKCMKLLGEI